MNKLLNVSRKGGFPWAAETADTLNRNFRYIEAIMDGFNIGYREAIILSDQNNGTPLMYIKDMGWEHGKIVSTTTQILAGSGDDPTRANLLKNSGKYTLIDNSQKISIYKLNSDTEKYEDCILNESYEIVLADTNNPAWTFYEMNDFFERERWVSNMVPFSSLSIVKNNTGWQAKLMPWNYTFMYKKINSRLHLKLRLSLISNYDVNITPWPLKGFIVIEIPQIYVDAMKIPNSFFTNLITTYGILAMSDFDKSDSYARNIASFFTRESSGPYDPPKNAYISLSFNEENVDYHPHIFINGTIQLT